MSKEIETEMKEAHGWDRIQGPSVTDLFPPRTQAQRPGSHFISSPLYFT